MNACCIYLDRRPIELAQLCLNASKAARGLHALGVREGDVIAILMRNDFAFIEATEAAAALGAYCVPINWHGKPDEIGHVIADARPRVLVAHADLLAPLRATLPADLHVLVVPTPPEVIGQYAVAPDLADPAAGEASWPGWLEGFEPWHGPAMASRSTLIYTSGTTGRPKGVRREPATAEQTAEYNELTKVIAGLGPGSRAMIPGPLYHATPNGYLRMALPRAETLVITTRFDAEETLAIIERHRITHAAMVPTMFVRIMKLPPQVRRRYDVGSLQWVLHTGAPCAPEVKKAIMAWWGPVLYETYGGTEVGSVTVSSAHDWLAFPGSVGKPAHGARIAIHDPSGRPVNPGEVGEIYMRQPALADFTYVNAADKRSAVERDGLISVGDIGYMKDGRLYICDRKSDMVISGGVNIYPAEIESVLVQCPGVQDCAVFGIPDDEFGESLAAAVQLTPAAVTGAAEIRAFLEERIARFKVPRRIDFHESLPREDSGKIFKRRLRDPFWEATGRRI
ncbi:acyl-CoA synthetase [soil metagenome]